MNKIKVLYAVIFILFITFISIKVYYQYYQYYDDCEVFDFKYLNKNPLKCCILLTMHIGNNDDRRQMYVHRVKRWLNETSLDIYTVESSGELLNIKHPRLYQYTFKQEEYDPESVEAVNKTILERNSILNAYNNFKEYFKNYDIIFKVTGKYFIPSLEKIIRHIKPDCILLFQHLHNTKYEEQNTEITGYHSSILYEITNSIQKIKKTDYQPSYEKQIKTIQKHKTYKTYRLPPLKLEEFTQRGDGSILKYL